MSDRRERAKWAWLGAALSIVFASASLTEHKATAWAAELPPASTLDQPVVRGPNGNIGPATSGNESRHNKTITRQIDNAPGWQPNTVYSTVDHGAGNFGNRVVMGPAWSASRGTFTNGLTLCGMALVAAGKSGATQPAVASDCAGGNVTDGTAVWKYLTKVDYVTIFGYLNDNITWAPRKAYPYQQVVVSNAPPEIYILDPGQTSGCTSGAGPVPSRGGSDGNCTWDVMGPLTYSSEAGFIPIQIYYSGTISTYPANLGHQGYAVSPRQDYYVGQIWDGGIARPEYNPGSNGEPNPIFSVMHGSSVAAINNAQEINLYCLTAGSNTPSYVWGSCGGTGVTPYWTITLQAAPSDSFQSVTTKPLSYNSANGVSIHNTNASGNGPISTHAGSAFNPLNDGGIGLSGLQVKADHGLAWDGVPRSSVSNFIGDILEGAGWSYGGATICAPVFSDAGLYYFNSLIIFDGTCSNPIGVPWSYGGFIVNTTIVNASGLSPSACMVKGSALLGGRDHPTMYNDYCAGWTYQFGEGNNQPLATLASNLSPTDTTITFNSGPYDDVVSNGIVIDNEVMAVRCVGPSYTTCNATRGLLGTKAASHRAGAYEAPYPFTDGGTNATDAPSSGLALFKSSLYQYPTGMWHMLGIQNTCGTGNSSPCFGQSASSVFINPTTDFRQNSSSPLIGAGQSYTANLGGGTPLANTKDILNQTRPSDAKYDIGAEQFKRR